MSIVSTQQRPRTDGGLEERFRQLADTWWEETQVTSSLTDLVLHPAYQQIIGMGPPAVPLILRELRQRPGHWFWALYSILGENPVPPEEAGDLRKMTDRWFAYIRQRCPEYLPDSATT